MLMALLYSEDNCLIAAAPACDQIPYGDEFWSDIHQAVINTHDVFETAYLTITNSELRKRLMALGIDESIDGFQLTREVDSSEFEFVPNRAA